MKKLLALFLVLLAPLAHAESPDDLDPDKIFKLATRVRDANTLEATWTIAPGNYLYRDKFKFEVAQGDVVLKPAVLPAAKEKKDPTFGDTFVYYQTVTALIPIERRAPNALTAALKITYQGCNEPIGVCFNPITVTRRFALPVAAAATVNELKPAGSLKELSQRLQIPAATSRGGAEPIPVDQAFRVTAGQSGRDEFTVRFDVADCCYLYRKETRFELAGADGGPAPAGLRLGAVTLPKGKIKDDPYIGKTEIYTGTVDVKVPVPGLAQHRGEVKLKVTYQGCSEKGVAICYAPETRTFTVRGSEGGVVTAEAPARPAEAGNARRQNLLFAAVAAFLLGLGLTLTPCVLPMIPILSSVLVGSGDRKLTRLEGGLLSYSYVLGTALTYTVAGVIAGLTGDQLQAYFQNIWAIGIFAGILVTLALSMFGFYELQMPHFVQSALHLHSSKMHQGFRHVKFGAFFGVFGMGVLSALIVGACASPILLAALGSAFTSRDPVLGGVSMFALAHGAGVPLVAIGVGAGWLIPKVGPWMNQVKHFFGVLLLGAAIYLLGQLPEVPVLLLWAALFIVTGIYLGATQSLPADAGHWRYFGKGVGTLLLAWGVIAMLGGFLGGRDILNPLPLRTLMPAVSTAPAGPTTTKTSTELFERVSTPPDLDRRLAEAKRAAKPVVIDYFADWCTDCARMDASTFADANVHRAMVDVVRLKVDISNPNDAGVKAFKARFGVFSAPALIFINARGEVIPDPQHAWQPHYGYHDSAAFLAKLAKTR
jgi:thiol:disulfide interchange protein DsbD